MMKHIQKSLKRKTKLEVDVKEQSGAKDKSDAKEQSGGNGAYQFLKKYLDMIFSRETELKKEQEDSLERLTKLKEIEKYQNDNYELKYFYNSEAGGLYDDWNFNIDES